MTTVKKAQPVNNIDPANSQAEITFQTFYPYYLSEHQNPICRALHYIGSVSALMLLIYLITQRQWSLLPLTLVVGYGFAWIGHYFFEHNKPATFKYPRLSFIGDWIMLKDFVTGQINRKLEQLKKSDNSC